MLQFAVFSGAIAACGPLGQIGSRPTEGTPPSADAAPAQDAGLAESGAATPSAPTATSPTVRRVRRLNRDEYARTLQDLLSTTTDYGASLPADTVVEEFDTNADALVVDPLFADQVRQNAEAIAAGYDLSTLGCATQDRACAEAFIDAFGARALRRPVTSDEHADYLALYDAVAPTGAFDAGARTIVEAMLQSPGFLYRTELGVEDATGYALTSYEVASELSYLLWRSMPDDALFAKAAAGGLSDAASIAAEVTRMLALPKADGMLAAFADQWLELGQIAQAQKDATVFPTFGDGVRADMVSEAHAFFSRTVRDPSATIATLFTSSTTYLTPALAGFYGVTIGGGGADASGLVATDVSPARGGLLTLGALLTTQATPIASNPVRRGKVVRVRLLCQDVPPPPPGLMVTIPPLDPNAPNRVKFGDHDSNPACSGCHQLLDPIGFGFEGFDAVGRVMPGTIDTTGAILDSVASDTTFDGVRDLESKLATSTDVRSCYARQWLRFGRGLSDTGALDTEVASLAASIGATGSLQGMLTAIATSSDMLRRDAEVIPPP